MKLNYIGYDYLHEPDFFISRPEGRKDSVFLLLRTPAIFNINGKDIKASKNSFILFREGTPQFYRADNGKQAHGKKRRTENERKDFKQKIVQKRVNIIDM